MKKYVIRSLHRQNVINNKEKAQTIIRNNDDLPVSKQMPIFHEDNIKSKSLRRQITTQCP